MHHKIARGISTFLVSIVLELPPLIQPCVLLEGDDYLTVMLSPLCATEVRPYTMTTYL